MHITKNSLQLANIDVSDSLDNIRSYSKCATKVDTIYDDLDYVTKNLNKLNDEGLKEKLVTILTYLINLSDYSSKLQKLISKPQVIRINEKQKTFSLDEVIKNRSVIRFENEVIKLTKREIQCLYYMLQGKSAKETGEVLFISHRTVETYINQLKRKFKCHTKLELLSKINSQASFYETLS